MDGINNGARGYIDSIQTNHDDPSIVEVIWVVFIDSKIGQRLRQEKKYLLKEHKPENELAVPITEVKQTFQI